MVAASDELTNELIIPILEVLRQRMTPMQKQFSMCLSTFQELATNMSEDPNVSVCLPVLTRDLTGTRKGPS